MSRYLSVCGGSLVGESKVGWDGGGRGGGDVWVGEEYVCVGGETQKQTEKKKELLSNHLIPFN